MEGISLNLRRMTADDLSAVEAIQKKITRRTASDLFKKMLKKHAEQEDFPGYVAEVDGKVSGFILGEVKVGGFGAELTGWIELIGVEPELMGQSIGRGLAERLFQHFEKRGVVQVYTSVRWDSGDMLAYFKNLGFDRSPFINLELKRK